VKQTGLFYVVFGFLLMLLFGWFVFPSLLYKKIDQPMQFSHVTHTDGIGYTCQDCHFIESDGRFSGIPSVQECSMCHAMQIGETEDERILVEEYVLPEREIPWLVYSRQPENVYFPHVQHTELAAMSCETCHGDHGSSEVLHPFERNRISGYSRDIWGRSISRLRNPEGSGMKMNDCIRCHERNELVIGCLGCHK
jgi:menaquinone reductase, multiheme cytochrome c subunit